MGAPGPDSATARTAPRPASSFDRLEFLDRPTSTPTNGSGPAAVSAPQLTRRGRLRKWDRPKESMDWRWWVGNLGKTLIATGLLMFGFVAYQLWGTGIETARAQNELESEFDAQLADAPAVEAPNFEPGEGSSTDSAAPPTTTATADVDADPVSEEPVADPVAQPTEPAETLPPVPVAQQNIPALQNGDALARLEIPRIGRNDIVVAGVKTGDLKRGPGHFPDTPLPGQLGNAAIAGHRTTYGSPFFNVDELQVGDDIIATTLSGRFTYRVTGSEIVASNRYDVVATADPNRATLTLISCHPKYTAQKRIVVFSELVASESAPVGEPIINYGRPDADADVAAELPSEPDAGEATLDPDGTADPDTTTTPGVVEPAADPETATAAPDGNVTGNLGDITVVDDPNTLEAGQVSNEVVDAFSDGWFSDPGANNQVGMWGALLALVGVGAYFVSRKLRRDWAGALIGIMPFVVMLYFFFQNVNRLLPPNL
jgi:sortase A